jgi:Zn-dependent peptidase ImmA (M78 family)
VTQTPALSPAKAKAREILAELRVDSLKTLLCLKEICVERGAFVKEQDLDGAEARLVVSGDRGIITVHPDGNYPARTRFSIAHELGHFELHRKSEALWACDSGAMDGKAEKIEEAERRETEANEFAAELLLPESMVKPEFDKTDPSLACIKEVAQAFQTSLSATASRFAEVTSHACSVVFWRKAGISRSIKSPLFDRQKYWIPQGPLSAYSHAYAIQAGKPAPPGPQAVEASARFQIPPYLTGQKIVEHSEYFKSIDLGITLLWIQPGRLLRHA